VTVAAEAFHIHKTNGLGTWNATDHARPQGTHTESQSNSRASRMEARSAVGPTPGGAGGPSAGGR
jgi:hypothetical protein